MTFEIRRRTVLVASIAVVAGVLAAGYLWRFTVGAGWSALALTIGLAVVAGVYAVAWRNARTPLLIADSTGLRVRLGLTWVGLPWESVDRTEVMPRGLLRDGRVVVVPHDADAALAGAARGARWAAAWNRRVYGVSFVVPFGLATTVSNDDVAIALKASSEGRADVVTPAPRSTAENAHGSDGPTDAPDLPRPRTPVSGDVVPVGAPALPPADPGGPPPVTAKPVVVLPLRPASTTADRPAARREDVQITMRRESVDGTLALSAQPDEVLTEELPEIAELRRHPAESGESGGPRGSGNIALIIDATTDLSARAMSKVRQSAAQPAETDSPAPGEDAVVDDEAGVFIGAQLRQARENVRLSVDDLADRTRIRPFVIECMETDDFTPCGGDFYARGHLRMLARVLGIASDPLIEVYDEHFATSPVSLRAVFDAELASGSTGMVRGGTAGANWGGLVAAVVILVVIWGVARYFVGG